MPSKKKKYNARFPPARIKKIMQSDEEVGKVAQAVPVIISRVLELFVESLLTKAAVVTGERNAKTMMPGHLKQCILAEQRFDFLKDIVSTVPDGPGGTGSEEISVSGPPSAATPSTPQPQPSVYPGAGPLGQYSGGSRNPGHSHGEMPMSMSASPFQFPVGIGVGVPIPAYYGSGNLNLVPNFYGSGSGAFPTAINYSTNNGQSSTTSAGAPGFYAHGGADGSTRQTTGNQNGSGEDEQDDDSSSED